MSHDHDEKDAKGERELPPPDRTYADHSFPAYSPTLVRSIVAEAVAKEREACAAACEGRKPRESMHLHEHRISANVLQSAANSIRARSTQPDAGDKS